MIPHLLSLSLSGRVCWQHAAAPLHAGEHGPSPCRRLLHRLDEATALPALLLRLAHPCVWLPAAGGRDILAARSLAACGRHRRCPADIFVIGNTAAPTSLVCLNARAYSVLGWGDPLLQTRKTDSTWSPYHSCNTRILHSFQRCRVYQLMNEVIK